MLEFLKKPTLMVENETTIVKKIHKEFDEASDKILEMAKGVLKREEDKDAETFLNLRSAGFIQLKNLKEYEYLKSNKREMEKIVNGIKTYNAICPQYKFITENEIQRICKKYGLAYARSEYYTGDMPVKNARDINQFMDFVKKEGNGLDYYWRDKNFHDNFYVVAPISNFDKYEVRYNPYTGAMVEVNDPIVLCRTDAGFLIITKWGAEENIEEIK